MCQKPSEYAGKRGQKRANQYCDLSIYLYMYIMETWQYRKGHFLPLKPSKYKGFRVIFLQPFFTVIVVSIY